MIEIERLTKKYGDFVAVDDVSLTVQTGEVFGFLGPNGAGKTTTIRVLAGLSLPTAGRIRLAGVDVVEHPRQAKAITGYVPDRPYLYEKLTGWEFLRFVADLYSKPWPECEPRGAELAHYLDVDRWLNHRIESYSHGMKQKLVLVSAFIHDPRVLVIDEPMVGLDALAQKQVKNLFRTRVAAGKTIFLTTHTLSVAEAVCDRVAILSRGRIVALGTSEEIKREAERPATALEDVFLELTAPEGIPTLE